MNRILWIVALLVALSSLAAAQTHTGGKGGTTFPVPASAGLCWVSTGTTIGAYAWGACSGTAATAFSAITGSTNTTAALVIGTGASLTTAGSGTITATSVPFTGVSSKPTTLSGYGITDAAPSASPTFTGTVTFPVGQLLLNPVGYTSTDAPSLVVRRLNSTQTSLMMEFQSELNARLSGITKDGSFFQAGNTDGCATWATGALTSTGSPCGSGSGLADPGANGVIKRTSLNVTAVAVSSDIYGLWSGTCNASSYLRGDGACATPTGSGTVSANNTANAHALAVYSAAGASTTVTPDTAAFTDGAGALTAVKFVATQANSGLDLTEGTCANVTIALGHDIFCPNSSTHTIQVSFNNSAYANLMLATTSVLAAQMPALTGAVVSTAGTVATTPGKIDVTDANVFCAAAGANTTTYTCSLAPAVTAYVTGTHYRFKSDVANTAASTINFNSVGAVTIKKAVGGVTTDLVANDLRAGQWVDLVYDGANMQIQSTLGNGGSGGTTLTVDGASLNSTANLSSSTPVLPVNQQGSTAAPGASTAAGNLLPVTLQKDASNPNNISMYVPGALTAPSYRVTRYGVAAAGGGAAATPFPTGTVGLVFTATNMGSLATVAATATQPFLAKEPTASNTTADGLVDAGISMWMGWNIMQDVGYAVVDWNSTAATWNERAFWGVTHEGLSPFTSDTPTFNGAVWRASSNVPDTQYQCLLDNGTASPTPTASGVTIDTLKHDFRIFMNDSTHHAYFYIDQVQVCDVTTNYPTVAQTAVNTFVIQPITTAVRNFALAYLLVMHDSK